MDSIHEDRYVLFVRSSRGGHETEEHPLASCPTYAEARVLLRRLGREPGDCVIRFVGPSGGGD